MNTDFNYQNTEVKTMTGGGKIVRKVSIKNGKGYKSVTKYHKGKKHYTNKKPIHIDHVEQIKIGKFIPGLFLDCNNRENNKTRRNRK
jgi:hypothetical protein